MSAQANARDIPITNATLGWIKTLVVGENLCPFAKREIDAGHLRVTVTWPQGDQDFIEVVLAQLVNEIHLLESSELPATTLMVLPQGADEFDHYLDLLSVANDLLDQMGHAGVIQLASFHPDYAFAGEPQDSPSHFTNRSPYPMLHLLREKDVSAALASCEQPELIPQRNIDRMHSLGREYLEELLTRLRG